MVSGVKDYNGSRNVTEERKKTSAKGGRYRGDRDTLKANYEKAQQRKQNEAEKVRQQEKSRDHLRSLNDDAPQDKPVSERKQDVKTVRSERDALHREMRDDGYLPHGYLGSAETSQPRQESHGLRSMAQRGGFITPALIASLNKTQSAVPDASQVKAEIRQVFSYDYAPAERRALGMALDEEGGTPSATEHDSVNYTSSLSMKILENELNNTTASDFIAMTETKSSVSASASHPVSLNPRTREMMAFGEVPLSTPVSSPSAPSYTSSISRRALEAEFADDPLQGLAATTEQSLGRATRDLIKGMQISITDPRAIEAFLDVYDPNSIETPKVNLPLTADQRVQTAKDSEKAYRDVTRTGLRLAVEHGVKQFDGISLAPFIKNGKLDEEAALNALTPKFMMDGQAREGDGTLREITTPVVIKKTLTERDITRLGDAGLARYNFDDQGNAVHSFSKGQEAVVYAGQVTFTRPMLAEEQMRDARIRQVQNLFTLFDPKHNGKIAEQFHRNIQDIVTNYRDVYPLDFSKVANMTAHYAERFSKVELLKGVWDSSKAATNWTGTVAFRGARIAVSGLETAAILQHGFDPKNSTRTNILTTLKLTADFARSAAYISMLDIEKTWGGLDKFRSATFWGGTMGWETLVVAERLSKAADAYAAMQKDPKLANDPDWVQANFTDNVIRGLSFTGVMVADVGNKLNWKPFANGIKAVQFMNATSTMSSALQWYYAMHNGTSVGMQDRKGAEMMTESTKLVLTTGFGATPAGMAIYSVFGTWDIAMAMTTDPKLAIETIMTSQGIDADFARHWTMGGFAAVGDEMYQKGVRRLVRPNETDIKGFLAYAKEDMSRTVYDVALQQQVANHAAISLYRQFGSQIAKGEMPSREDILKAIKDTKPYTLDGTMVNDSVAAAGLDYVMRPLGENAVSNDLNNKYVDAVMAELQARVGTDGAAYAKVKDVEKSYMDTAVDVAKKGQYLTEIRSNLEDVTKEVNGRREALQKQSQDASQSLASSSDPAVKQAVAQAEQASRSYEQVARTAGSASDPAVLAARKEYYAALQQVADADTTHAHQKDIQAWAQAQNQIVMIDAGLDADYQQKLERKQQLEGVASTLDTQITEKMAEMEQLAKQYQEAAAQVPAPASTL